ncbi:MAG TPA: hypothetical protein VFP17_04575 [Solirubrobacterales bacterium]|nr:hypothetical protein [Solirubrobacterales bacterium]
MKHLKMLGAATAAALTLVALLGGATASANVLCKTETNPCGATYPEKTALKADLISKKSILELSTAENTELSRCGKETLTATITNPGTVATNVTAAGGLEFSECEGFTKVAVKSGPLEIRSIPGTVNGTVMAGEIEWTVNVAGADCKWRTTNADLGTLVGGADPTLEVKLLFPPAFCYPELMLRWTATFTFTNPIYVEPS